MTKNEVGQSRHLPRGVLPLVIVLFSLAALFAAQRHVSKNPKTNPIDNYYDVMPANQLAQRLSAADSRVRYEAVKAAGRRPSVAHATVDGLVAALDDSDAGVRYEAAHSLGKLGSAADPAIPRLIDALEDPSLGVRMRAAQALGRFGPKAREAVPLLIQAVHENANDRSINGMKVLATEALLQIDPDAAADASIR